MARKTFFETIAVGWEVSEHRGASSAPGSRRERGPSQEPRVWGGARENAWEETPRVGFWLTQVPSLTSERDGTCQVRCEGSERLLNRPGILARTQVGGSKTRRPGRGLAHTGAPSSLPGEWLGRAAWGSAGRPCAPAVEAQTPSGRATPPPCCPSCPGPSCAGSLSLVFRRPLGTVHCTQETSHFKMY